ncbi:MAG TPA: exopolysaccharide biosynthesis polyprenyl glycosylphosphotransferase [Anaerolineaceae bacterium]|jgi:exopolysaccharide biosynthesis polyprenyl glycosylphosphotransferase
MATNPPIKPIAVHLRSVERRLILVTADLLVSGLALLLSLYFWAQRDQWLHFSWNFLQQRIPLWFWFLPLLWILLINELYDIHRANSLKETGRGILVGAAVGAAFYLIVFFLSEPDSMPRQGVATFIILSAILTLLWRWLYIRIFTAPLFMRRVLIVGAGKAGSTLCSVVNSMKPPPFLLVGLIDDSVQKIGTQVECYPVLGNSTCLEALASEYGITDLIVAISGEMRPEMFQSLVNIQERGISVRSMPAVYEELLGRVPIFLLQSDWILRAFVDQAEVGGFYEGLKRLLDILGGLIGSLFLVILFPIIALLTILETGRPVIFTQKRLGMFGEEYWTFKFRTMVQNTGNEKARVTTAHDERITRTGLLLRKSHLDEWPQFLNVLRGDMSLVGPRPERSELVSQLQANIPFYRARLLVKPGLTGWAQVNFGYAATLEDTAVKLEYDLYYIKHRNLLLDFIIMVRTVGAVVGFRGQ